MIYAEATATQARKETGVEPIFWCIRCSAPEGLTLRPPSAEAFAQAEEVLGEKMAARFYTALGIPPEKKS